MIKICSICKVEKDGSEFSRNSAAIDGKQSRCKSCLFQWTLHKKQKVAEHTFVNQIECKKCKV